MSVLACPVPFAADEFILLGHGSGGRLSAKLMDEVFLPSFRNSALERMDDQAVFDVPAGRVAMSTDTYVVKPMFFPGGNLGELAVYGTVNDLAVGGATPKYLSAGFVLEEGLPLETLRRLVSAMAAAARRCGVEIVTGDTKVVEKGSGDGAFINTTGLGFVPVGVSYSAAKVKLGDRIVLSGTLGEHGIAILAQREGLELGGDLRSDAAPLHELCAAVMKAAPGLHAMRDLTRGGLSSALNEIARSARVGVEIDERAIPVRDQVRGACELFGLDPLYVANEGKMIAFVPQEEAEAAVAAMQGNQLGRAARVIGVVTERHVRMVTMRTTLGTERIVDMLAQDQLPRIC
jgi:hydrogenase expression/formation protein HypE